MSKPASEIAESSVADGVTRLTFLLDSVVLLPFADFLGLAAVCRSLLSIEHAGSPEHVAVLAPLTVVESRAVTLDTVCGDKDVVDVVVSCPLADSERFPGDVGISSQRRDRVLVAAVLDREPEKLHEAFFLSRCGHDDFS